MEAPALAEPRIESIKDRISRLFCGTEGVHAVALSRDSKGSPVIRVYLKNPQSTVCRKIEQEAGEFPVEFVRSSAVRAAGKDS